MMQNGRRRHVGMEFHVAAHDVSRRQGAAAASTGQCWRMWDMRVQLLQPRRADDNRGNEGACETASELERADRRLASCGRISAPDSHSHPHRR